MEMLGMVTAGQGQWQNKTQSINSKAGSMPSSQGQNAFYRPRSLANQFPHVIVFLQVASKLQSFIDSLHR